MHQKKYRWDWLTIATQFSLYNQEHGWVVPVSLLLYAVLTIANFLPYQAISKSYGDGSLLLFREIPFRVFTLNIFYILIVANVGFKRQCEHLILHRFGSRLRMWLSKSIALFVLTVSYLGATILVIEVASLPFMNHIQGGWSELILINYEDIPVKIISQPYILASTIWFILLSWLALGGVAFVISQITGRASIGFVVAVCLNISGFFVQNAISL